METPTYYTVGKDSQGNRNYYHPDIIKIDVFQTIMEKTDVPIYSNLSHTQCQYVIHIHINLPQNAMPLHFYLCC